MPSTSFATRSLTPAAPRNYGDFRLLPVLRHLANPSDREMARQAAPYMEMGQEISDRRQKASGIVRPTAGAVVGMQTRTLTVGSATAGGNLVGTDHRPDMFAEYLRNRSVVLQTKPTVLNGLRGDVGIPKQSAGSTAGWVAEGVAVSESDSTFAQLGLSPATVGCYTDISRKLLIQSDPSAEHVVMRDLADAVAEALDAAVVEGSGVAPVPEGIFTNSDVATVALGTDGAAVDWDAVVNLEEAVSANNADIERCSYLTNSAVRSKLKRTEKFSGSGVPVWEQDGTDARLNGYSAFVSNSVPRDMTKGGGSNLSGMIFGNWSDLIVGHWGGVDLILDPYTNVTSGTLRVVVMMDVAVGIRRPESFAKIMDAVTT